MKTMFWILVLVPCAALGQLQQDARQFVTWYGAKGDGITDNSAAFTRALATNKTIRISSGVYAFNGPFRFPGGGISVIGNGDAYLRYTGTTNVPYAFAFHTLTGDDYNLKVEGVTFQGNSNVTTSVVFHQTDHISLKNVRASDCTGSAVIFATNVLGHIDNMSVSVHEYAGGFGVIPTSGIDIVTCNSLTFNNPTVEGVSGVGFVLRDSTGGCNLFGGTSEANGSGMILTNGAANNIIINMDTEQNSTAYDIYLDGCNCNQFNEGFSMGGIYINNSSQNVIKGGIIQKVTIDTNAILTSIFSVSIGAVSAGYIHDYGVQTEKLMCYDGALNVPIENVLNNLHLPLVSAIPGGDITISGDTNKDVLLNPLGTGKVMVNQTNYPGGFTIMGNTNVSSPSIRIGTKFTTEPASRDWAFVLNRDEWGGLSVVQGTVAGADPSITGTNAFQIGSSGVRAIGYLSNDGSVGITQTNEWQDSGTTNWTMVIKNGLITSLTHSP